MLTTLLEPRLRLTICGLDELDSHGTAAVTHVLSILDPDYPEPRAFAAYDPHHRLTMRFHDIIGPWPGWEPPERHHVEALVEFGGELDDAGENLSHLLVHCHAGISRSTAAMATLLARHTPVGEEAAHLRPHPRDPPDRLAQLAHGGLRRRHPRPRRPPQRRPARALPDPGPAAAGVRGRAASATAAGPRCRSRALTRSARTVRLPSPSADKRIVDIRPAQVELRCPPFARRRPKPRA